jgi:RNA polymerase sigma-70 factor, ECF subfamily
MACEQETLAVQPPDEVEILMRRYQQADGEAAVALIDRLSPRVFQFFLAQVRDRAQAEDLLQDFWLRVHKARHTFRDGEPLLPWVYAIAHRTRVDQYRRTRKVRTHEVQCVELPDMQSREPSPVKDALPALADLLETLPAAQRETVLLLKVSGLSLDEVARATGSSVGAVKQRAHRAYEKLRKVFGERA